MHFFNANINQMKQANANTY